METNTSGPSTNDMKGKKKVKYEIWLQAKQTLTKITNCWRAESPQKCGGQSVKSLIQAWNLTRPS